MPDDTTPIPPEELDAMPFEQALERLESLVAKMETGRLPLEELMREDPTEQYQREQEMEMEMGGIT